MKRRLYQSVNRQSSSTAETLPQITDVHSDWVWLNCMAHTYVGGVQGADTNLPTASEVQKAKEQRSKNAIPIIVSVPSDTSLDASSLRSADLDGVALSPTQLASVSQSFGRSQDTSVDAQVQAILNAVLASPDAGSQQDTGDHADSTASQPGDNGHTKRSLVKQYLTPAKEELVEAERQLLQQVLGLLEQATPQMEELSMLTDALKQLDELFLLVVVGEFNSGKSSVINALLGSRYAVCCCCCCSTCCYVH